MVVARSGNRIRSLPIFLRDRRSSMVFLSSPLSDRWSLTAILEMIRTWSVCLAADSGREDNVMIGAVVGVDRSLGAQYWRVSFHQDRFSAEAGPSELTRSGRYSTFRGTA